MQPLNPFLRGFFRSALPSQCQPVHHHILLVPTTETLLYGRDRESGSAYSDVAGNEDFLGSHVLRVPGGVPPQDGSSGNVRESKGRAKQYTTINGKTVIVKDAFVYSNKGFRSLNQAQLLQDAIYYPDASDGQQWLVYYISRPLLGSYQPAPIMPAVISDVPSQERKRLLLEASAEASTSPQPAVAKKKDPKTFQELLNNFPMISRQMQRGLEITIREFTVLCQLSKVDPFTLRLHLVTHIILHPTALELEPEEDQLRVSLERTVASAIDLFQKVDQQQLSMLGSSTSLTGPVVERLIERYMTEQVHDQTLFPRICAVRYADDRDLENKVRKMSDVDIAQVGIPVEDGMKGKRELATRLRKGVDVFKKMGVASSPQEMLEILLSTQKAITAPEAAMDESTARVDDDTEKVNASVLTINADILVSMLLVVVIRSGVRHLHSRLLYMRYFIFTDEVESGEQGYALATMEAVLAHLTADSTGLRKSSKRNRGLWQAIRSGDIQYIEATLQPTNWSVDEQILAESPTGIEQSLAEDDSSCAEDNDWPGHPYDPVDGMLNNSFAAVDGSLSHVFPFQRPPTPPPEQATSKGKKRVSLAASPRSHSVSSSMSNRSRSRTKSLDSGVMEGDLTAETMAQTQDADGNSTLMMAVEAGQAAALRALLNMPAHFRLDFVLKDINYEGSSLLSAAVQSSNRRITEDLIAWLERNCSLEDLQAYLAKQDRKGRCMAHYLFHQPYLIRRFGKKLPWRLKDNNGQTPLFALCRSYDHEEYQSMVDIALVLARDTQGDNQALHLDDHVDAKGNTLLHVVNDTHLIMRLLRYCDSDVNATNDKRFTPLMVGSKYGRLDLVRALFSDPRTDTTLKDIRGLTAVELAKDDEVRNRFDDLVLLASPQSSDGRMTAIVRSFFVEDATIRLVLKSGGLNPNGTITVTTCRRSVADFENLSKWLTLECPASWLPTRFDLPSPFLIPSRPARSVLRDTQLRLDNFFRNLLSHSTFSTHELVWEFFLVPDIDSEMLLERSKRKAETRVENVRDDYEPVSDTQEVENFVVFAREQMRGVTHVVRKLIRSTNRQRMLSNDLFEALLLSSTALSTFHKTFLPQEHISAYSHFARLYFPSESSPFANFYYSLHSIFSSSSAIQAALNRPAYLIGSMHQTQQRIERSLTSLSRQNRWTPDLGGLFTDAKKSIAGEARDKAVKAREELDGLARELRYTQTTVAGELAGWQEEHVKVGRAMLKKLARDVIVKERAKLEGIKRCLREARRSQGGVVI
ncbi:hypothetical protein K431DRAFT_337864 [Polychaeton citri CBS 116435]|uniref:VPS9 domain-containing protein n=1 Tax=Polychaeton citri CBS 116435 TaxID=1314669 RepID=A0A9P4QBM0_9PEZI|nr:hypothetical protein K431DRAFT_337864 [Polychaeton citri CBS 116435]